MNRQNILCEVHLRLLSEKCRLPPDTSLILQLKRTMFLCQNPTASWTTRKWFIKITRNILIIITTLIFKNQSFPRIPSLLSIHQPSSSAWAAETKYHKVGVLSTAEMYFSQFWRLDVCDQGANLPGIWWRPSSGLQTCNFLHLFFFFFPAVSVKHFLKIEA